jgi:serine/threonine-protein kinase
VTPDRGTDGTGPTASDADSELARVLDGYLAALERGEPPDPDAMLAAHPALADRLRRCLGGLAVVARAGAALRGAGEAAIGPYRLVRELGRGGMGVVYEAVQEPPGRVVALKVILAGEFASPTDIARFQAEAEVIAGLDHPHIVPVYEVGTHGGRHYFSMKRLDGGTLTEHLDGYRDAPRRSAELVATIARAVHHAHQRGVLHRDLKPGNILLDEEGRPYVGDFGLARRIDLDSDLTRTSMLVGSPPYMAPEQAGGRRAEIRTATDVYGLGAILYALLTGRPPFRGETPLETIEQVRERTPKPPSALNPLVDRDLQTVCLKCLEKDPARRYESARELAEDLERWQRGEPVLARPASRLHRLDLWCRRPGRIHDAGAFAIVLAGMLLTWAGSGLALIAAGVLVADRPWAIASHLLRAILIFYVPMILIGWRTLVGRGWAIRAGLGLALAGVAALVADLIWQPYDLGGVYSDEDLSQRIAHDLLILALTTALVAAYGLALRAQRARRVDRPARPAD